VLRWLDALARGHRIGQGLGALLGMLLIVGVGLVLKCQDARDPYLGRGQARGVLVAVVERTGKPLADDLPVRRDFQGTVELADGREVTVTLPQPPPEIGELVPVSYEIYESGKRNYRFDLVQWRASGAR
jgi:hypothetical protein